MTICFLFIFVDVTKNMPKYKLFVLLYIFNKHLPITKGLIHGYFLTGRENL